MHVSCLLLCVLIYFSFIWLLVYAFAFKSKVHGGGASALPYYHTPPVTVPDIIGGQAVWRHTNKKKRSEEPGEEEVWCSLLSSLVPFVRKVISYSLREPRAYSVLVLAARPCGTVRICSHSSLYWDWCSFKMITFPAYCARSLISFPLDKPQGCVGGHR